MDQFHGEDHAYFAGVCASSPPPSRRRGTAPVARRVPLPLAGEGLSDELHRIGDLALVIELDLHVAVARSQASRR